VAWLDNMSGPCCWRRPSWTPLEMFCPPRFRTAELGAVILLDLPPLLLQFSELLRGYLESFPVKSGIRRSV
jgi:hypothetical protein